MDKKYYSLLSFMKALLILTAAFAMINVSSCGKPDNSIWISAIGQANVDLISDSIVEVDKELKADNQSYTIESALSDDHLALILISADAEIDTSVFFRLQSETKDFTGTDIEMISADSETDDRYYYCMKAVSETVVKEAYLQVISAEESVMRDDSIARISFQPIQSYYLNTEQGVSITISPMSVWAEEPAQKETGADPDLIAVLKDGSEIRIQLLGESGKYFAMMPDFLDLENVSACVPQRRDSGWAMK